MRLVAFLRAINVGGRVVPMSELRGHFETMGFKDVETFIASGNVLFSSRSNAAAHSPRIEKGLASALGYEVATFIRSDAELAAIAVATPFPPTQLKDARTFVVGFVREPPTAAAEAALMARADRDDRFQVDGREIYWMSRKGQSDSTFSNVQMERLLKVRTTFRGMNTVRRLVDKFGFR